MASGGVTGSGASPAYLLTTSFGMADCVVRELCRKPADPADLEAFGEGSVTHLPDMTLTVAPFGLINAVLAEAPAGGKFTAEAFERLASLRSIHDILLYHGHLQLPSEEEFSDQPLELYNILRKEDCPIDVHTLRTAPHFRVSCQRTGKHKFKSSNVEMEAGGAFHERYGLPAKMKKYDACIRVDIHINTVVVGTLVNTTPDGSPYSKRHKLAFVRTVTLKPNVAFAMLQLAGVKDGDTILDPFTGSGTIVLEAMEVFPNVKCYGLDRSGAAVKGATANAEAAGLSKRVDFVQGNARLLHKSYDFKFDHIVSNLPWGLKTGCTADIKELYTGAIASAWGALKVGGTLTTIILHDYVTVGILRSTGNWDVLHARVVKTGGKLPGVIVARKREKDPIFPALKTQRANLYRYIQDHPLKTAEVGAQEDDAAMGEEESCESAEEGEEKLAAKRPQQRGNTKGWLTGKSDAERVASSTSKKGGKGGR